MAKNLVITVVDWEKVTQEAVKELEEDQFREAVKQEKERLRNRKFWFPWRIRMSKLDLSEVTKQAREELNEERIKAAKKKLKTKMQEVDTARKVYENAQRELDELIHELENGVD